MKPDDSVQGVLLDIDGVLHVDDAPLPGAGRTLEQLRDAGLPVRFVTNTSTRTAAQLGERLRTMGLDLPDRAIFSAVTAARRHLETRGARRVLFAVADAIRPEFSAFGAADGDDADCVLVGDIGERWDHALLERLFRALMAGAELVALHRNRYWQTTDGLRLDIGAYVAALEAATGRAATVVGKPDAAFFALAAGDMGVDPAHVLVVGDDIESDIGGAQGAGMRGVLVRTGKYRDALVARSEVRPDAIIDSIAALPGWLGLANDRAR